MRARAQGSVPGKVLQALAENRLRFLWCGMDIQEFRLHWDTFLPSSFQNSASAFCVQTKIISLSVFKKILPKSNNVCNDKNMSTLTSWLTLCFCQPCTVLGSGGVWVLLLLGSLWALLKLKVMSRVELWPLFFFLASYFLLVQNESPSVTVSFMTMAQDPRKSLFAVKLTQEIYDKKGNSISPTATFSLFLFLNNKKKSWYFSQSHFTWLSPTGLKKQPHSEFSLTGLNAGATPVSIDGLSDEPDRDYTSKDAIWFFGPSHLTFFFKNRCFEGH